MTGFGENLRREREMRGISLEEISDTTKISVRLLDALERGDFGKLPGGIFIRSFIRSYAGYLGLDEEQVLAEFQLVAPPRGDEDFSRLGVTAALPHKTISVPILPWVIAIFLLAGGYAIFRYSHRSSEPALGYGHSVPVTKSTPANATTPSLGGASASSAPANSSVASNAPNTAALQPTPLDSNAAGAATGPAGDSTANPSGIASVQALGVNMAQPAKASPSGRLSLQVVATEPSWVAVKSDGKMMVERVLNPNEVLSFSAKDAFDITTGNAEGIVLTLNGVTLKPLGRRGEVKTLHLTPDDLKNANP